MARGKIPQTRDDRTAMLFACIYFASYVTRINLGAVIQEVVTDTGFAKETLSVILVCLSASYGIGQVINGRIGDKIKPQDLILTGLATATAVNFLFPFFSGSTVVMCLLWTINGFAQAMLWPPMVKILVSLMDEAEYGAAVITVNMGGSAGTILVYLLSPLMIQLSGWKLVLFSSAVVGLLTTVLWGTVKESVCMERHITHASVPSAAKGKPILPAAAMLPMLLISLAIVFQGMLRDGVTSWMPTFLVENFNLGNEVSILCTVSLAVFSMLTLKITGAIYKRWFRSEVSCAAAIFAGAFAACGILLLFLNAGAVLSILCMTAITGAMHGVNLMLISHVPKRFRQYGNISTISGLVNAFTYVGAAIATYGIAKLSALYRWRVTVGIWTGVAFLGTVCCLTAIPKWKKFTDSL